MKNIKYSVFDLFSYAIPGLILFSVYVESFNVFNIENQVLKTILKKDNIILLTTLILLLSYFLGFITNIIGGYYFKLIGLCTRKIVSRNSNLPTSTKIILLREFSPSNFNYIEKWNSMKNMCSNLSVVIILSTAIIATNYTINNLIILLVSIPIITLLTIKAFQFDRWSIIELDNAIGILELEDNCVELLKSKLQK